MLEKVVVRCGGCGVPAPVHLIYPQNWSLMFTTDTAYCAQCATTTIAPHPAVIP